MTLPEQQAVQPKSEPKAPLIRPLLIQVSFFELIFSAYGLTVVQAVNDQERTNREATNEGNSEVFTEGGAKEHDNAESSSYCYAENQDGEVEHEEAYEEYADAQEYFHTSEDAHAREEADQVVAANNEPESVLEVDVIHEGSADPESTEIKNLRSCAKMMIPAMRRLVLLQNPVHATKKTLLPIQNWMRKVLFQLKHETRWLRVSLLIWEYLKVDL